jgi:dipeptidyl aminopeptidase/acylaminoacyl peptidase
VSFAAPPAEAFGAPPAASLVVLSSDGRWLAWLDQKESKPRIAIIDVNAHRIQRLGALPEGATVRALTWSDDETLLATLVGARVANRYALTIAMNPTKQDAVMLPTFTLLRTGIIKPHTVIMSEGTRLLEVDTITGKSDQIATGERRTVSWAVDRAGTPVAREDWDPLKGAYRVYALKGKSVKEILRKDDSSRPTLAGILPDDSALVLLASNGKAHQAAWALPLDGSPQKLLAEDPDADITAVYTDAYTGAIVGVYASGAKADVQWLDPTVQHRQEVVQRTFPDRLVELYGWTRDGTKTLVRVESASSPPTYYFVDFTAHSAEVVAEEYPALSSAKLGEQKEITFKARDGTQIPAYLTVPPEKATEPGPLVVFPHAGPTARDYPNFKLMVQFLASRGYTVLQPQFRGSSGFGEAYQKAGYRQWGGLMQDDVTDGVRAMIEQKIADPRHVCIVGIAYGGYAALAGVAFTPELYTCAISVNGISDLRAFFYSTVPSGIPGFSTVTSTQMSAWVERIGPPASPALERKSPINFVGSIKAPVLMIYSGGDVQSLRMAEALRAAGKRVTSVNLADGDPGLGSVRLLKAFETFLHDNL